MQVFFLFFLYLFIYIRWHWYFLFFIFYFCYLFYIDFSLMSNFLLFHSNIYEYIIYRISVLWSVPTYQWVFILFGFCFFIFFLFSRYLFFSLILKFLYIVFLIFFLFFYSLWFFQELVYQYIISYFEYNIILAHSLVSIHPPLLLFSVFLFRFFIFFSIYKTIHFYDSFDFSYLFVLSFYYFVILGIVLGSFWSVTLFGWGGWWIWDPIENISFYYLICLVYLLHIRRFFISIFIFFLYLDIILYYSFKFHFSESLHVFSSQLFTLNVNYWFYFLYLLSVLCVFFFFFYFIFSYSFYSFLVLFFYFTLFSLFSLLVLFFIDFIYLNNNFFYYLYYFLLFILINYVFFVGLGSSYISFYYLVSTVFLMVVHPFWLLLVFLFYWSCRLYTFFFLHHYVFLFFISFFLIDFINNYSYIVNWLDYVNLSFLLSSFLQSSFTQELSTLCWDFSHIYLKLSSVGYSFDNFNSIVASEYTLNTGTREKNILFLFFFYFFSFLSKSVFNSFLFYQISFILFILFLLFIYLLFFFYYLFSYFFSFDEVYESILR